MRSVTSRLGSALLAVWVLGAGCGGSDGEEPTGDSTPAESTAEPSAHRASLQVGGSGATLESESLRASVLSVTDRGKSADTGEGTLEIKAAERSTKTIIGVEMEIENTSDSQGSLTDESFAATSGGVPLDTALVCDEMQCAGSGATWFLYEGSPRAFTAYFIADQGTTELDLEFKAADAEPPSGTPEAPAVPVEEEVPVETMAPVETQEE